jgi:murein DD-endopeptidase MepM/ murein hydrolase activator NlpD
MLRRFYTVMIVPHEGGALRRLSVSMNFVISMGAIFLFCFVSSAFLAQFFLGGMNVVGSEEKLRVEIQRLAAENSREKAAHKESLLLLEQYSEKYDELRRAKGVEDDESMDAMGGGNFDSVERDGLYIADDDWRARAQAIRDKAQYSIEVMDEELCQLSQPVEEPEDDAFWPVHGRITSGFGMRRDPFDGSRQFHEGVDIATQFGTAVLATEDGVVEEARRHGGYGNMVLINHGDHKTLYGHLRRFIVQPGQKIKQGDEVGEVGSTGRSTGPHLHFERLEGDKPVDPMKHYG